MLPWRFGLEGAGEPTRSRKQFGPAGAEEHTLRQRRREEEVVAEAAAAEEELQLQTSH